MTKADKIKALLDKANAEYAAAQAAEAKSTNPRYDGSTDILMMKLGECNALYAALKAITQK